MPICHFNLEVVHDSWKPVIQESITKLDPAYLNELYNDPSWLPGPEKIFNAFTLPINKVNYVLFGESPYPRAASANGYAFWDNAVTDLWSPSGLSKQVNRATSLRNLIKMMLIADNKLTPTSTTQDSIAQLEKKDLIKTNTMLFNQLLGHGFLLLNTTLILRPGQVRQDAKQWSPFIKHLIEFLIKKRPGVQLILFGQIAYNIQKLIDLTKVKTLYAEHPYNLSFITNQDVLDFFTPLHLLRNTQQKDKL